MSGEKTHPVEALSALLDGEVAEQERQALESHLAACAPCRERLEDLRLIDRAVAAEDVPPVPVDLAARIRERLDEPTMVPAAARPMRVPLAAAASLLAAGLLWVLRSEMPLTSPPHVSPETPAPVAADRVLLHAKPVPPPPPTATLPEAHRMDAKPPGRQERKRNVMEKKDSLSANAPAKGDSEMAFDAKPLPRTPAKDESSLNEDATMKQSLRSLGYIGPATSPPVTIVADEKEPVTLEAPPYRVRLLPDGRMNVETAGYTCAVAISRQDGIGLADIVAKARARQQRGTTQAAQAVPQAEQEETAAPAAVAAPAATPPSGFVSAGAARACAALSPDDCRFVLSLVRERYRLPIAQRCGPPPR